MLAVRKRVRALKKKDKGIVSNLKLLLQMIKDSRKGEYKKISMGTKLVLLLSAVYIAVPVDIIPDFLPFVGALDDVAVLSYAIHTLSEELKNYKLWLSARDMTEDEAKTFVEKIQEYRDKE